MVRRKVRLNYTRAATLCRFNNTAIFTLLYNASHIELQISKYKYRPRGCLIRCTLFRNILCSKDTSVYDWLWFGDACCSTRPKRGDANWSRAISFESRSSDVKRFIVEVVSTQREPSFELISIKTLFFYC